MTWGLGRSLSRRLRGLWLRQEDLLRRFDRRFQVRPESFAALGSFACAIAATLVSSAIFAGGCGPRATGVGASSLPPATPPTSALSPTAAVSTAVPKPVGGRLVHVTLYHLASQPCPDAPQVALPRCGGGAIASVSAGFLKSVRMQGSARLCDGRVVGVQKLSPLCFVVVAEGFPWGVTASGRAATPFRSIAVDPKVLPLGHWYYVRELDGATLPPPAEGQVHDGCVHADDVGGAVKGDHVDWFVGDKTAVPPLRGLVEGRELHIVEADAFCGRKP